MRRDRPDRVDRAVDHGIFLGTIRPTAAGHTDRPHPPSNDEAIERMLFALLDSRARRATVCPSDVARRLVADEAGWRALMPRVRAVAAALVAQGRLRVTRRGVEVDAEAGGGPIRLGRPDDQSSRS